MWCFLWVSIVLPSSCWRNFCLEIEATTIKLLEIGNHFKNAEESQNPQEGWKNSYRLDRVLQSMVLLQTRCDGTKWYSPLLSHSKGSKLFIILNHSFLFEEWLPIPRNGLILKISRVLWRSRKVSALYFTHSVPWLGKFKSENGLPGWRLKFTVCYQDNTENFRHLLFTLHPQFFCEVKH